jgi:hypothetical protein
MILICTATHEEAKPLIDFFALKQAEEKPFSLWGNEKIELVISGIGKIAAASATSYIISRHDKSKINAMLNIGVASHKTMEIGTPVLIHKFEETFSSQSFYPTITFDSPCFSQNLLTADNYEQEFDKEDYCYDTEGFGYYYTAIKFLPSEIIHSLKIISKNTSCCDKDINSLLKDQINIINDLINKITLIADKMKDPKKITSSSFPVDRFNSTVNQKHHLKDILFKINALNISKETSNDKKNGEKSRNSEDVINKLKKKKSLFLKKND